MKTLQLKDNFYWAGILDKNLRVFDIIMYTEFGTTYNSYVLKAGDKTILFETAKAKFTKDYEDALANIIDVNSIDYIVVDHTDAGVIIGLNIKTEFNIETDKSYIFYPNT